MIVRLSLRDRSRAGKITLLKAYDIIKRPIITEKLSKFVEENFMYFEVDMNANKYDIAKACELIFEMKVASVNTLISKYGKSKFKNQEYVKSNRKKAMVKFADKIDINNFVRGIQ